MPPGAARLGTGRGRPGGVITHNLTSTIRDLHRRKARGRRGLTLVEGIRLIEEAVAAGLTIRGAVYSPALRRTPRGAALHRDLEAAGIPLQEVSAKLLDELADTETPQGILAVLEPRSWSLDDVPVTGRALLVLDGVQDPGNAGTLVRTAHALGAAGTIALQGTADPWSPKALRGAMGATFRHPVVTTDDAAFLAWARDRGVRLWAAAADGRPLDLVRREVGGGAREGAIAIIVGNEGAGIRPELAAAAAARVAIPLEPGVESLNVGVAAGILLYEVQRGR